MKLGTKHLIVIALVATTAGCVTTKPIDQTLLDTHLTRTYPAPRQKCFTATVAALKDFKTPIESQSARTGDIVTERTEVTRTAYASHGTSTSVAQTVSDFHKYFLKIDGDAKGCSIRAVRYQVWQNNIEASKVNVKWADANVWQPLFKSIEDRLGVAANPPKVEAKPAPVY